MLKLLTLSFIVLFYVAAWLIQDQFLLKGDVSWQIHLARIVFAGGDYVKDFFEINPPLSIYLYMPTLLIQYILATSTPIALRIYIFLLATFSLIICHYLLKKIFIDNDRITRLSSLLAILFVYLILPMDEFGQRESLLVYLTMPYFLLVSLRLTHPQIPISRILAISIGILAGLGFAIKPFFLLALGLVELYYLLTQSTCQRYLSYLRAETLSILTILILYLFFIYIYHPTYIKTVVPIASRFYYQFFSCPWSYVALNPLIMYIGFTPLLFFILPAKCVYKKMVITLIAALIGFLIAYLAQQLPWYYHAIPAFSFAILVCVILFSLFLTQNQFNRTEYLFAACLGALLFLPPFVCIRQDHAKGILVKKFTQPLVKELRENENNRYVYFFSSRAAYMVSVLEQAGALHASRLQFLAWMQRYFRMHNTPVFSLQQQQDENFFVGLLAEDIKKNKPDLIYVDQLPHPMYQGSGIHLDYLKILSKHQNFKEAWKAYHYWKTIEDTDLYKFDVYKRNSID